MTADFKALLLRARNGDEDSFLELLLMYKTLLLRESVVEGIFNEDLYQEHCITFLRCVRTITIANENSQSDKKSEHPNDHALS